METKCGIQGGKLDCRGALAVSGCWQGLCVRLTARRDCSKHIAEMIQKQHPQGAGKKSVFIVPFLRRAGHLTKHVVNILDAANPKHWWGPAEKHVDCCWQDRTAVAGGQSRTMAGHRASWGLSARRGRACLRVIGLQCAWCKRFWALLLEWGPQGMTQLKGE